MIHGTMSMDLYMFLAHCIAIEWHQQQYWCKLCPLTYQILIGILRWNSDIGAFLPCQHLDQAFICVMVSNLLNSPLSGVILALSFKIRKQIWCGYISGCLIAGRSLISVCRFVRARSHDPTTVSMFPSVKVWGCIRSVELRWLSVPWCSWLCSVWLHAFWL